jgi:hypothetical protein
VRDRFLKDYMDDTQPQTLGEYLWLATTFKLKTLPVIAWQSTAPEHTEAKQQLLQCTAWAMDNRAFTPFAHEMRSARLYSICPRCSGFWLMDECQRQ